MTKVKMEINNNEKPKDYFRVNKILLKILGIPLDGNPGRLYWMYSVVGWVLMLIFEVMQFYSVACMIMAKETRKLVDLIDYESNLGASKSKEHKSNIYILLIIQSNT